MKISTAKLHSVCDFTPFEGFVVKGIPSVVIKGGKVIVSGDELFAIPGEGKHIKRNSFKVF